MSHTAPPDPNDRQEQRGLVAYRDARGNIAALPANHLNARADDDIAFQPRDFIAMMARRAWLIGTIVLLCLLAASAYILLRPPIYRAVATLEVQPQEAQILQGASVQPVIEADADFMQTQYELLRSRALAERIVDTLDLDQDPRYAKPVGDKAQLTRDAATLIGNNLSVEPIGRSRMIAVTYESRHPGEAARIANAVADHFIQSTLERRYNQTAYARGFLEDRLNSTKASLEEAERKLVAYAREKSIIDLRPTTATQASVPGGETALDASSLVALNTSLSQAQDARIAAEHRYNEALTNPESLQSLQSPSINLLRQQRATLNAQYQENLGRFKPEFPEMQDLMRRINAIDGEIQSERANIVSALNSEYRAALARESALRTRVEELKNAVQDTHRRSIDYNILAREVDTLRSQYNALLQRFKEVSIGSGVGSSQVSVIDRASMPRKPFAPDPLQALLLGVGLGIALALAIAALVDYVDDTIKTAEDVKKKLGIPVLGIVPKTKTNGAAITLLDNPLSSFAEAYASTRTALQFALPMAALRTLLITGSRPGEGKTSTSVGLAYAFAGIGKRVLIIDADLRRPSFDFDANASIGLSGLLTSAEAFGQQAVVTGHIDNIALLPAGAPAPNPAELLASPRFAAILEQARMAFDIVIVDAPPVLDFADAPFLSSICDATILVCQSGGVMRPAAQRTLERLYAAGGVIAGAVLTKFDFTRAGHGYGDTYAAKYGGYGPPTNAKERAADQARRVALFRPRA